MIVFPNKVFVLLNEPRLRKVFHEFIRFAAVGAVTTGIHYTILISLVERAHAPLVPATSAGFTVGVVVSYLLNRRITFAHQPSFGGGLLKFIAVGVVGLALNALIVAALVHAGLPYMLGQIAATGIVLVWNFTLARLVVFRAQPHIE